MIMAYILNDVLQHLMYVNVLLILMLPANM